MRRAFGLIVVVAALGSAAACFAQQQSPQNDNYQSDAFYIRKQIPPAKFVPAKAYAEGVAALRAKRYKEAVRTLARVACGAGGA